MDTFLFFANDFPLVSKSSWFSPRMNLFFGFIVGRKFVVLIRSKISEVISRFETIEMLLLAFKPYL